MAMMKCPECGKDVSDKAEACMNCGFSIKQYMIEKEFNEDGRVFYCPRCAEIYCWRKEWTYEYEEVIKDPTCIKCKYKMQEPPAEWELTPYFCGYIKFNGGQFKVEDQEKKFIEEYVMKQPEFNEEEYKKSHGLIPQSTENSSHSTPRIGPKCPACGSYDTAKVGVLGRAASVFAFGLASNKIGKNWKCRKCGHTW